MTKKTLLPFYQQTTDDTINSVAYDKEDVASFLPTNHRRYK